MKMDRLVSMEAIEELTLWQRYPDTLQGAVSQRNVPARVSEFCALLQDIDDPLVTLSSLSILARNRFDRAEWKVSQAANLFYASPGVRHLRPDYADCNSFIPDQGMLDDAWDDIEETASVIVRCCRNSPTVASVLTQNGEMSKAFWESAFPDESLRRVVRGALLAAMGVDIRLLDFNVIEAIRLLLSNSEGTFDSVFFLN